MLSRGVSSYPWGGRQPMPGPPVVLDPGAPAGSAGMRPSRFSGRDDTLLLTGPVGAGEHGYRGRDPETAPHPEGVGIFLRLHAEGAA